MRDTPGSLNPAANLTQPYDALSQLLGELQQLTQAGDWEAVTALARHIEAITRSGSLGKARPADRLVIEASLQHLDACLRKAEPNRDDIARLLKGFGVDPGSL